MSRIEVVVKELWPLAEVNSSYKHSASYSMNLKHRSSGLDHLLRMSHCIPPILTFALYYHPSKSVYLSFLALMHPLKH